jgi:excisionase family DNA binding protein
MKNEKICYSVEEVGEILGVSRSTAFNLVKSDGFPSFRIGKRIIVPKDAFHRWLNEQVEQRGGLNATNPL